MTCTTARISSIYPFGLFRASIDVPVNLAWLIYPRPVMNAQDLLGCQSGVDLLHNDSALKDEAHAVSGGGDDFSGHRPYRDGDSQHHIDWRAVARGRPLLTKLYVHGTSGLRHIDWRQFVDDDLEHRLSRITGQVVDAKRAGVPFVLRLPDHMLDDHGDPGHYCACLSALALFGNG
jgi:hypothetical protein